MLLFYFETEIVHGKPELEKSLFLLTRFDYQKFEFFVEKFSNNKFLAENSKDGIVKTHLTIRLVET